MLDQRFPLEIHSGCKPVQCHFHETKKYHHYNSMNPKDMNLIILVSLLGLISLILCCCFFFLTKFGANYSIVGSRKQIEI